MKKDFGINQSGTSPDIPPIGSPDSGWGTKPRSSGQKLITETRTVKVTMEV